MCCELDRVNSWCLTGTPMARTNGAAELSGPLEFIKFEPFATVGPKACKKLAALTTTDTFKRREMNPRTLENISRDYESGGLGIASRVSVCVSEEWGRSCMPWTFREPD